MPHIRQDERQDAVQRYYNGEPLRAKDVAFIIADVIDDYIGIGEPDYATLAEVDGILGTTHDQYRERVVRPFERRAAERNTTAFALAEFREFRSLKGGE